MTPLLTEEHKLDRVEWAREHLTDNWSKTIFSDEASFWVDDCHVSRWVPHGQKYSKPREKFPPKLHVWAAISMKGVFGPTIWRENMDGELYTDILNYNWGDIQHTFRYTTNWRFQQDGDSKHRCTKAKYFFMQHKVRVLLWPSNSPDLSPIENLWSWIKREVDKLEPKDLDDLEVAIEEVFKKIDKNLLFSLIESMPKRLKLCIESNGETIDY